MAHFQEVHRRIFQDLPEYRPGEFWPDAPGHFKNRELEASINRALVPYAHRPEIDRNLAPTVAVLDGRRALKGYDGINRERPSRHHREPDEKGGLIHARNPCHSGDLPLPCPINRDCFFLFPGK